MKLETRAQYLTSFIDTIPIINVIFLLVIFVFLLSSPFVLQPGIQVSLPQGISGMGVPQSNHIITVKMPSRFKVNPEQKISNPNSPALTSTPSSEALIFYNDQIMSLEKVSSHIAKLPKPSRIWDRFIIKADRNIPNGMLLKIINTVMKHNWSVVIATNTKEEKAESENFSR